MTTNIRIAVMAVCLIASPALLARHALAQANYAGLGGVILDPQQHATPGATIELIAKDTGAHRRTISNELGIFQITGLPPGDYALEVTAVGFEKLSKTLRLETGQQVNLALDLKVETVIGTVDVLAQVEFLGTADASVGDVVEGTAVENLPLNGRMMVDLELTVPGAHISHGAQTGDMNPLYWRPGQRSSLVLAVIGQTPTSSCWTALRTRT